MTLKESINEIKTHLTRIEEEVEDLTVKNRKSSAPRARKSALLAKGLLHTLRVDISKYHQSMPVNKRVTISETPDVTATPPPSPKLEIDISMPKKVKRRVLKRKDA